MPSVEQRLQRLEDDAAIRELAARFADAGTRNDMETIRALFTKDAVFSIGKPNEVTVHGRAEIAGLIQKLEKGKDFFVQFIHTGLVKLEGDKASARWLVREVALGTKPDGDGKSYYNNFGYFDDELAKADGKWLFKSRAYRYIYLDLDPFNGKAIAPYTEVSFT